MGRSFFVEYAQRMIATPPLYNNGTIEADQEEEEEESMVQAISASSSSSIASFMDSDTGLKRKDSKKSTDSTRKDSKKKASRSHRRQAHARVKRMDNQQRSAGILGLDAMHGEIERENFPTPGVNEDMFGLCPTDNEARDEGTILAEGEGAQERELFPRPIDEGSRISCLNSSATATTYYTDDITPNDLSKFQEAETSTDDNRSQNSSQGDATPNSLMEYIRGIECIHQEPVNDPSEPHQHAVGLLVGLHEDLTRYTPILHRVIQFLQSCGYFRIDILSMFVYASCYLDEMCLKEVALSPLDQIHSFLLYVFLAHCYTQDECCPLKYWHQSLFKHTCSVRYLNESLFRLQRSRDFKLRVENDILKAKYLLFSCRSDMMKALNAV